MVLGDCPQLDEKVRPTIWRALQFIDPAKRMIDLMIDRRDSGDDDGLQALWHAGSGADEEVSLQFWFGDYTPENFDLVSAVVGQAWQRIVEGDQLVRCVTYGKWAWYTAGIVHLGEKFFQGDWNDFNVRQNRARQVLHEFHHLLEVLVNIPRDVTFDGCDGENWYASNVCYGPDNARFLALQNTNVAPENVDNYAFWMRRRWEILSATGEQACANPWNV